MRGAAEYEIFLLFFFFISVVWVSLCVAPRCHAPHQTMRCLFAEVKMIYSIRSAQFSAFLATGKRTPTTDEVCDALTAIKEAYPMLEPTDVSS